MPRFRKKPVEVEAVQWGPDSMYAVMDWLRIHGAKYGRVVDFPDGTEESRRTSLRIFTLEGEMLASPGDWIIRGIKGEFYPCKPDIFAETYEEIRA